MSPTRTLLWPALFYFTFFSAIGVLAPFINIYYQSIGLDAGRIGVLAALPTLVSLLASPLVSGLADRFRKHRAMLVIALIGNGLVTATLFQLQTFGSLAVFVLLQAFFGAPINPLADNAILEQLGAQGRHLYGRARLWGAVGFGGAAYGVGALIAPFGMHVLGPIYAAFLAVCAWVSTHLPAPRSASAPQLKNLKALLRDARWRGMLGAMLFGGLCSAIHGNFFLLYLHTLGASPQLFGGAVVLASLSEVLVFFLSTRLVQRGHARAMVIAGMLTWVLREALCALIANPQLLVLTQVFHGLAYSAMWTGAITLTRERVPVEWGATAQAILTSVTFGAAWGLGALLGGQVLALAGAAAMFGVSAGCAALALTLFLITQRGLDRAPRELVAA